MNTKKKDTKQKAAKNGANGNDIAVSITTKEELKAYLLSVRDRMREQAAASIFALAAIHYVMNLPEIYTLLDNENKELARDIWLRLKQSGLQVRNPGLLFRPDEEEAINNAS